jgi:Eco57I restriction-modification methylase/Type III restriction enzyme, res subunit
MDFMPLNSEDFDKLLAEKDKPCIYAFRITQLNNALKIGFTSRTYKRIEEWAKIYSQELLFNNWETVFCTNDDNQYYFKDFIVHDLIVKNKCASQVQKYLFDTHQIHYSKEFYSKVPWNNLEDAYNDVKEVIEDIKLNYLNHSKNLIQYNSSTSDDNTNDIIHFNIRESQSEVVNNYQIAKKNGYSKMLLFAIMRFGKTFTALHCALTERIVIVLSAKKDVKDEWKNTIRHQDFNNCIKFYDSDGLQTIYKKKKEKVFIDYMKSDKNNIYCFFFTLQEILGDTVKEKHWIIDDISQGNIQVDLVIIDEAHYGTEANQFGFKLKHNVLKRKRTLYISGTPYKYLLASKFEDDEIIGNFQLKDLFEISKEWENKNYLNYQNDLKYPQQAPTKEEDWKNPYFGFPTLIRCGIDLEKYIGSITNNKSFSFSQLFSVKSTASEKFFKYEDTIIDIFKSLAGILNNGSDSWIPPLLNLESIKRTEMCQHIVVVLPTIESCDTLCDLFHSKREDIGEFGDYDTITITSNKGSKLDLRKYKNILMGKVKSKRKTISFTVRMFLTGTTIKEWDTMLYFKDTTSPQEYDQSIFRLQTPYLETIQDNGNKIVLNKKPQTLLIDFSFRRQLYMIQQNVLINNYIHSNRTPDLKECIEKELEISPLFTITNDSLVQINYDSFSESIFEYRNKKTLYDEVFDLPIDYNLFDINDIRTKLKKYIKSKNLVKLSVTFGNNNPNTKKKKGSSANSALNEYNNIELPIQQLRTLYFLTFIFVYLSKSQIRSTHNLINHLSNIDDNENEILSNIGIDRELLVLILNKSVGGIRQHFDEKLSYIDNLKNKYNNDPVEMLRILLSKFDRLSENEFVTPVNIAKKIVDRIPFYIQEQYFNKRIIDVASKSGEFTYALFLKFNNTHKWNEIKNNIFSIPTSSFAYEMTRKVYELLGFTQDEINKQILNPKNKSKHTYNSKNICKYCSYKNSTTKQYPFDFIHNPNLKRFLDINDLSNNIYAILGNPPYHIINESGGSSDSAKPIYNKFVEKALTLQPDYISMLIPSKWMVDDSDTIKEFRDKILGDKHISYLFDYEKASDCIPKSKLDGGISYFLWEKKYVNPCTISIFQSKSGRTSLSYRFLLNNYSNFIIRDTDVLPILEKVLNHKVNGNSEKRFSENVSSIKPFGIRGYLFNTPERYPNANLKSTHYHNSILIHGVKGIKGGAKRTKGYIDINTIPIEKRDLVHKYKIFFSANFSTNSINPPETIMGNPGEACTETFLMIGPFDDQESRDNCDSFMKTNFFKFLLYIGKGTMHVKKSVFELIPSPGFNESWDDDKLCARYHIDDKERLLINSFF